MLNTLKRARKGGRRWNVKHIDIYRNKTKNECNRTHNFGAAPDSQR